MESTASVCQRMAGATLVLLLLVGTCRASPRESEQSREYADRRGEIVRDATRLEPVIQSGVGT